MNVETTIDKISISLSGRLDAQTSEQIRGEITALAESDKDIEIDMAEVTFVDSSGLGLLVSIRKKATLNDNKITLRNLQKQPMELFRLSRLYDSFNIE